MKMKLVFDSPFFFVKVNIKPYIAKETSILGLTYFKIIPLFSFRLYLHFCKCSNSCKFLKCIQKWKSLPKSFCNFCFATVCTITFLYDNFLWMQHYSYFKVTLNFFLANVHENSVACRKNIFVARCKNLYDDRFTIF